MGSTSVLRSTGLGQLVEGDHYMVQGLRKISLIVIASGMLAQTPLKLTTEESLQVRELQLKITRASNAKAQAEKIWREADADESKNSAALRDMVKKLQEKYKCKDCELDDQTLTFKEKK
jgi:F0F1-type ATP synthase epsilon subunit